MYELQPLYQLQALVQKLTLVLTHYLDLLPLHLQQHVEQQMLLIFVLL